MADLVDENDDQWLYGSNAAPEGFQNPEFPVEDNAPDFQKQAPVPYQDDGPPGCETAEYEQETAVPAPVPQQVPQEQFFEQPPENINNENEPMEDGELKQNGDDSDKEGLDDDSDDDINVVIGDIKAPTAYSQPNIKRGGLTTTIGDKSKQIQQTGKFSVEEFEQVGNINGVPSVEYNLDSLEDKPWRKPGADISDYFNYGFTEDTWKAYCDRQRRIRLNESGVGVMQIGTVGMPRPIVQNFPMPRPMHTPQPEQPKMNVIQVMTADRREYSRKPVSFPDMTVPPPFSDFQPDYSFNPEPEPFYGGYEPTQDSQWMDGPSPNWQPTEIKTLVGGASPTPSSMGPPSAVRGRSKTPESIRRDSPPPRARSERPRGESRARSERPRDRSREKSRRRERAETRERSRSRSKSRRHRSSRSRSPSHHKSHKKSKKSSRRHSDSD